MRLDPAARELLEAMRNAKPYELGVGSMGKTPREAVGRWIAAGCPIEHGPVSGSAELQVTEIHWPGNIHVRWLTACQNYGVTTLGQLAECCEGCLSRWKNVGHCTLDEVQITMARYGMQLRERQGCDHWWGRHPMRRSEER